MYDFKRKDVVGQTSEKHATSRSGRFLVIDEKDCDEVGYEDIVAKLLQPIFADGMEWSAK